MRWRKVVVVTSLVVAWLATLMASALIGGYYMLVECEKAADRTVNGLNKLISALDERYEERGVFWDKEFDRRKDWGLYIARADEESILVYMPGPLHGEIEVFLDNEKGRTSWRCRR